MNNKGREILVHCMDFEFMILFVGEKFLLI